MSPLAFGSGVAFYRWPGKRTVLKVTISEEQDTVTMQLEGRVTGPFLSELQQAWSSLAGRLGPRKLTIDLRGVTHMNANGIEFIADIYKQTKAQFLVDTPMTSYFAERAQARDTEQGTQER